MRIFPLSLLFIVAVLYAQPQQRIAILGTEDDGEPSIKILELSYLTDKLREVAGGILPKSGYAIMTQQSIVDRLGSQEQAVKICREATCLADLGRKVNADYIAQARIGRFGGNLTIKVELYRVGNSALVGSFIDNSKDVKGLLSVLEKKSPSLFKSMVREDTRAYYEAIEVAAEVAAKYLADSLEALRIADSIAEAAAKARRFN
jgi:hypothetical protein